MFIAQKVKQTVLTFFFWNLSWQNEPWAPSWMDALYDHAFALSFFYLLDNWFSLGIVFKRSALTAVTTSLLS